MQVSKDGIERIRSANPLVGVVTDRGIKLQRKGKNRVATCPFHANGKEGTPSFFVSAEGLFHCFGCGEAGDVFKFVMKADGVAFPQALELLAQRAGLDLAADAPPAPRPEPEPVSLPLVPDEVVEHYHRTFAERKDAQVYLVKRGFDLDLARVHRIGYADGSLLKLVPKSGALREQLVTLGIITASGRELLGGCIVIPIRTADQQQWANLYGRGLRTDRHCYLPGPFRGVFNGQVARTSEEVILTESILDALSFHQAGIATAIPIYGTNGFTPDHLDVLKRERVQRVVLALDNDEPGQRATEVLRATLTAAGIAVRSVSFPDGIKDANELLLARGAEAFIPLLAAPATVTPPPTDPIAVAQPAPFNAGVPAPVLIEERPADHTTVPHLPLSEKDCPDGVVARVGEDLVLRRDALTLTVRPHPPQQGRLRATVRVQKGARFHVDTVDLYASRSRSELSRRAGKVTGVDPDALEADLLLILVEAERVLAAPVDAPAPVMTQPERADALALLRRPDLLDQVAQDVDALGYVGEDANKRLLYLVAISRKLDDPLSAIVLSQSGAGKSGITEVIERITPPEDVVMLTRLTPQSLYYVEPGFLDQKLVIVEERYGSVEADYSIRVLQSRKKLIAAAPVKDPATGNMRTKVFTVEARAAFIEATTASGVNHENATRCFELTMDESAEQTRRIHERQRLMKTEAGLTLRREATEIARLHWNAQRLLEPLAVVIPFADRLRFPSAWMRTRRDHARFLNLIEVSAFLHQHQRERRQGVIVAAVADYAVAYSLAAGVLSDTLSDLKKPLRDAYERVRELCGENGVSRRDIREALGAPDTTVRHWLSELVDLDYLETDTSRGGAGKSARYRLTERGPRGETLGLLSPDELRACL